MRPGFRRDTRGAAAAFSSISMLAVVLCVGYCINLADATHAKMHVQDVVDAAAYSGARVRGNLYAMIGFLNMAKIALYRVRRGFPTTEGQRMLLAQMARVAGISIDPQLLADGVSLPVDFVAEQSRAYAQLADSMQWYIANNFVDLIDNEVHWIGSQDLRLRRQMVVDNQVRTILERNPVEVTHRYPGSSPVFGYEDPLLANGGERYWGHLVKLDQWTGWEYWSGDVMRPVIDPDEPITTRPVWPLDYVEIAPNEWKLAPPAAPFNAIVIEHAFAYDNNSIKAVGSAAAPASIVLPGLFANLVPTITCTAAAGCFSPEMQGPESDSNLYTTDFRGQLLSLERTDFRSWLTAENPTLANRIPWNQVLH